jgi:hypothetical protein
MLLCGMTAAPFSTGSTTRRDNRRRALSDECFPTEKTALQMARTA